MSETPILEVRDLCKHFPVGGKGPFAGKSWLAVVNAVSFRLDKGETLALVGESGGGKTTLARVAAMLQPPTSGSVRFEGREITGLDNRSLKPLRCRIQMIFQDPYGSLNPRLPVGAIIAEPLLVHGLGDKAERRQKAIRLAEQVGLKAGDMSRYPHQFSGGQRQRIAIARAIAPQPSLVIADEPVSALDVSIQSQVLNLLRDLRDSHGLTYLFISHDLAVVRHFADRVAVMYLGRIVETAAVETLFDVPRHPYTRALIAAQPVIGRGKRTAAGCLSGDPPSPLDPPSGCPFHPRCPLVEARCRESRPELEGEGGHRAACHVVNGGGT